MLKALEARLGHTFSDPDRLAVALTHASLGGEVTYERMEFLGDRVLGLLIAEILLERDTQASEGALAPRLNALVRKETCARVARETGIAEAVRVSGSERDPAGPKTENVLADACEAVIAALYLDGGLGAARHFVREAWHGILQEVQADMRDPKTLLQEWSQGREGGARGTPVYTMTGRSGPDHAPVFTVEVSLPGLPVAQGRGRSKREAEQDAARALLASTAKKPQT